jgi:hypothetical protein
MNSAEIPIARPCTADWSRMTLADRGRFCGACRKVVRELAQMSEREARALLASPPTEGLCVRYVHDATGEILFRRDDIVPAGRIVRRAAMLALGAALPLASAACMGAAPAAMGAPPVVAPQSSATTGELPPQVMMGAPPVPPVSTTPAAESSPK